MRHVYLASRFQRRGKIQNFAVRLRARGYSIVSTWHDVIMDKDANAVENASTTLPKHAGDYARIDIDDMRKADTMIFLTEQPGAKHDRNTGGRHVEFGFALFDPAKVRIIIIGPIENVYHALETDGEFSWRIWRFETIDEMLARTDPKLKP